MEKKFYHIVQHQQLHLNEKDSQTVSCLSIKDIVSIYFPLSSIEQFIQICRQKQITRFKPDKSTDCDSTLRLVNIQELENHWNFIIKELLPNTNTSRQKHSKILFRIYKIRSTRETNFKCEYIKYFEGVPTYRASQNSGANRILAMERVL